MKRPSALKGMPSLFDLDPELPQGAASPGPTSRDAEPESRAPQPPVGDPVSATARTATRRPSRPAPAAGRDLFAPPRDPDAPPDSAYLGDLERSSDPDPDPWRDPEFDDHRSADQAYHAHETRARTPEEEEWARRELERWGPRPPGSLPTAPWPPPPFGQHWTRARGGKRRD